MRHRIEFRSSRMTKKMFCDSIKHEKKENNLGSQQGLVLCMHAQKGENDKNEPQGCKRPDDNQEFREETSR